tara:strand:+ start:528 stop:1421 length:894 start_codon:yes stop_codon:yes gene_type:complete
MRSIVTGGCGFIGSHIVDKLIEVGHEVIVIDDLSAEQNSKFYFNDNATYLKLDISKDDCSDYFSDRDYVFHLAARSRIQPTLSSPSECFEVNVVGTQRVLEWSSSAKVKKIIYSGTSSLYGRQNNLPFSPNMPTDCLNPYSLSKWMGELTCKLYSQLYSLDSVVLRYFNVYGPREPLKGEYAPVVGLFRKQKLDNKPMTIVGDGQQKRDFTFIDDVVEANIQAMNTDCGPFKTFNVGTGKNYSILELTKIIGGPNPDVEFIESRKAEVRETLADISETKRYLNWSPSYDIEEALKKY